MDDNAEEIRRQALQRATTRFVNDRLQTRTKWLNILDNTVKYRYTDNVWDLIVEDRKYFTCFSFKE
jgi:hypothetical protein